MALRRSLRQDRTSSWWRDARLATVQVRCDGIGDRHLFWGRAHRARSTTTVIAGQSVSPDTPQVRSLLADTLRAVMCPVLIKRKDGQGRVIAVEIMINNEAVGNLIRKGKTFQIPSVIATQRDAGMPVHGRRPGTPVQGGWSSARKRT